MKKKYITVLDYETSRVFQYKVPIKIHSQDFITMKGHRLANVEWMEHNIGNFVTN
jgi:hypothetical protein